MLDMVKNLGLWLISTPTGVGVLVGIVSAITFYVIGKTKTKADDKFLAKYGALLFPALDKVEKSIPDDTQVPALEFADKALKAVSDAFDDKDLYKDDAIFTFAKKQIKKVITESKKVDSSAKEMAKAKKLV